MEICNIQEMVFVEEMDELSTLDSDIQLQLQSYSEICNEVHNLELSLEKQYELAQQIELYTSILETIEEAEKRYHSVSLELQKQRRENRHKANNAGSISSAKRYNQLLIKYNISQTDKKNLERNYTELQQKYDKLLSKNKSHFQPLLGLSTSPTRTIDLKDSKLSFNSPSQFSISTPSPTRRTRISPLRTGVQNAFQSTPNLNGTSTPSPSARKILTDLSVKRQMNLQNSPKAHNETAELKKRLFSEESGDDNGDEENEIGFSKVDGKSIEKLNECQSLHTDKQSDKHIYSTPHGSKRVMLRRILASGERSELSPTAVLSTPLSATSKRSRTISSLRKPNVIRGGQSIVDEKKTAMFSPLKTQNRRIRNSILKKMN